MQARPLMLTCRWCRLRAAGGRHRQPEQPAWQRHACHCGGCACGCGHPGMGGRLLSTVQRRCHPRACHRIHLRCGASPCIDTGCHAKQIFVSWRFQIIVVSLPALSSLPCEISLKALHPYTLSMHQTTACWLPCDIALSSQRLTKSAVSPGSPPDKLEMQVARLRQRSM